MKDGEVTISELQYINGTGHLPIGQDLDLFAEVKIVDLRQRRTLSYTIVEANVRAVTGKGDAWVPLKQIMGLTRPEWPPQEAIYEGMTPLETELDQGGEDD